MLIFFKLFFHTDHKKPIIATFPGPNKESFGAHTAQLPSNIDFLSLIHQTASEILILAFGMDVNKKMLFLLLFLHLHD